MVSSKAIHCCECGIKVEARLTSGAEIYPHRSDLCQIPFWKCETCGNFVGCHHKTGNPTQPLGCIPSPEIKKARQEIHKILDPLWKYLGYKRHAVYKCISKQIGWRYHTAQIKTIDEARDIYAIIMKIHKGELTP